MNEFIGNEIVASGVHYVIKATRKLTIQEMNDAIDQRRTKAGSFPAQPGDTVKILYSPLPDEDFPELWLPEDKPAAASLSPPRGPAGAA